MRTTNIGVFILTFLFWNGIQCQEHGNVTCDYEGNVLQFCDWLPWSDWDCSDCGNNNNTLRYRGFCCPDTVHMNTSVCFEQCGYSLADSRESNPCDLHCGLTNSFRPPLPASTFQSLASITTPTALTTITTHGSDVSQLILDKNITLSFKPSTKHTVNPQHIFNYSDSTTRQTHILVNDSDSLTNSNTHSSKSPTSFGIVTFSRSSSPSIVAPSTTANRQSTRSEVHKQSTDKDGREEQTRKVLLPVLCVLGVVVGGGVVGLLLYTRYRLKIRQENMKVKHNDAV